MRPTAGPRRLLAAILIGGVAPAVTSTLGPAIPTAQAQDGGRDGALVCAWQWHNRSGYSTLTNASATEVNAGPYDDCNTRRLLPAGRAVTLHCYSVNKYGNAWWHVEVSGPTGSTMGWIYQGRLKSHPPNWSDEYGCKDGFIEPE